MGSSQILHMFFIITTLFFFFFITHISDKCHKEKLSLREEEDEDGNQTQIQKVSGEDENEEKEALIVKNFRALLGLKRSRRGVFKNELVSLSLSPAPSPSPSSTFTIGTEALPPARAPARPPISLLQIHRHPHSKFHHSSEVVEKKHRDRRVFVAVFVSIGAFFVAFAVGVIWVLSKVRKNKRISGKTMWDYGKTGRGRRRRSGGKSKYGGFQKSASKVKVPEIDLLYGLEKDLEQHNATSKEEFVTKSECSSSSTKEIMSVHGDLESVKYDSDGGNCLEDKVIPIEDQDCSSDDDESFHSFVDSCSSNVRLSNASAGSLGEAFPCPQAIAEHISTPGLNLQPEFRQVPNNVRAENVTVLSFSGSDESLVPIPPPPPPLPPPLPVSAASVRLPPSRFPSSITKIASFPNLSSPRKSDSSSSSTNQTPRKDIASSPRISSSIGPPPPPCPPAFSSSTKGPPPPPSRLPLYSPVGKDGAPLPKLKPLHWDKVRAAPDHSMVWDKIRSSSFEFDEEMMESLFGYNLHSTMKNDEAKSKSPSPSKHVLEPKRLQNLTILFRALNATPEQVCEALIRGEGLSLQQLEALAKMVPTKEEEGKLADYRGNINELGLAEKFVKLALIIPSAFQRVDALLYRETFEDEVVHLRNSFSMLEEACRELRSSRLFLKLLEAVLKTGNRMNVGTIRGGAIAFKLDALLKLSDVKGTDGKTTLLHFVVQEMIRSEGIRVSDSIMGRINQKNKAKTNEEKEEDYRRMGLELVSGLTTELYNVKKTATIDLDVLASSVSNLSEGMIKLQNLVFKDLKTDEKSGNFVQSMKTFIQYAERNMKELQEDENKVLLHVREITEYFHGNVSKEEANPLKIFVIVRDFLGMLDHVCKELRNLRVANIANPLAPFR
ncbi:formin-like protein 11 [Euphorbia lathyris]|uniref:formin-like protein 11 n=1 Tax=Euphorbia lathyris TaxID=212925 RepID=UPI00331393A5